VLAEALDYYRARDETFPGGAEDARGIEREVMLQIIDQRWRDHLAEMDYLKEGIGLRAMGQQDPLVAWQKEGYSMFEQLLEAIEDDYLRYVLHVQVIAEPAPTPDLTKASYIAADDPVGPGSLQDAFRATAPPPQAPPAQASVAPAGAVAVEDIAQVPLVKSAAEKLGRNDPCWCGSGKKFKLCHGAV
jgi:preprotein translocase subunit SecA